MISLKTNFYLILVIFFQRKELSENLKDNKKKYKQAKQKLFKTKKKVMFFIQIENKKYNAWY